MNYMIKGMQYLGSFLEPETKTMCLLTSDGTTNYLFIHEKASTAYHDLLEKMGKCKIIRYFESAKENGKWIIKTNNSINKNIAGWTGDGTSSVS